MPAGDNGTCKVSVMLACTLCQHRYVGIAWLILKCTEAWLFRYVYTLNGKYIRKFIYIIESKFLVLIDGHILKLIQLAAKVSAYSLYSQQSI